MLINKPQSSNRLLTSTFVSRQFPLSGDGTEQNKLKISTQGLAANQFWMWDGTQWIASSGGGGSNLPTQTDNAGKFLTTNGTNASWSAALAIAASKILTVNNTLTFSGTDSSTIAFGTGGNVAYTDVANTFTQNQIINALTLTGSSTTPALQINQTWNTTGAPSLLDINLTNSASNVASRIFNIKIAGTSRFSLNTSNQLFIGSTTLYPGLTSSGVGSSVSGPYFNISSVNNADYPGYAVNILSSAMNMISNPIVATNFSGGLNVSPGVFGINYTGANTIDYRPVNIAYTINNLNANTRNATGIFLNATETALNGMVHNLMDLQTGGTSRFRVSNIGSVTNSATSVISTPAQQFTGAWYTGGTSTTTKPHVLIEPANIQSSLTATFVNGNANITTATNNYAAGDIVQLATTGTLPTGFAIATNYYVIATGLSTTNIQLSATLNGAAITAGSAGSGAHTVTRQLAATISNNWNTSGTGLGINAASGFTGNLLDLQLNGASRFTVTTTGTSVVGNLVGANIIMTSNIEAGSNGYFGFNSKSILSSTQNGILQMRNYVSLSNTNAGFDRLQFGGSTSASPALQTASSNAQASLAATFTNGSATIGTATNTYAEGDVVQFATTGTLPTGFVAGTNYYVIATGLTTTTIQVSATLGGSAITAGSAGTLTHTVTRQNTCTFVNGSSTVTTGSAHGFRVGDIIRFSNSGGSLPSAISSAQDYYVLTIPSTTTFTFSSFFNGNPITPPETLLTATFSGTPNITTGTQNYVAGSVVRFATTGTLPTGLSTGTDYYVIATLISTTNIQVSATLGGTAIAYTGTGSGIHTVTRQILGNGIHFVTRIPAVYIRSADNSINADLSARTIALNAPTGFAGNGIDLKVGNSTIFTVSNSGNLTTNGSVLSGGNIRAGSANGVGWSGSSSDMVNTFNGGIRFTNSSALDFYQLQFGNGTTSPSLVTFTPVSATATFTAASATIGASPLLALRAGDLVQFTNSGGALPTEITTGTTYYVLASSLSATTIQVSESLGGSAITFAGVGTGTNTVSRIVGISFRNSPNNALVPQESLYQRFGAGSPDSVVTAPVGATYNRTDGGAGTSFYVKESGTGNTGWIAK